MKNKLFWVGVLYFAEGFPLGVFYDVFPVHLRQQGVDLWQIGFMSLLGLAWTLKFLWAPAVDYVRHHRRWIFLMDVLMGGVMLVFAVLLDFGPWVWLAIGLFTIFSATSDVAIDAYTIEMLNKDELGLANGIRNGMYRVGMLASGFILVLADWMSWSATYLAGALILFACGTVCLLAPPEQAYKTRSERSLLGEFSLIARYPYALALLFIMVLMGFGLVDTKLDVSDKRPYLWPTLAMAGILVVAGSHYWTHRVRQQNNGPSLRDELNEGPMFGAFFELIQRPHIIPVIIFILIYKLADTSMGFMVKPFWVDSGFSATEIGLVSVNIGLGLSIAGGLVGGWFTDRFGIFKGIWVLGLLQALSNLGYAGVAAAIPPPQEGVPMAMEFKAMMYSASVLESFTGGLGSAAFLAFLMAIVNKKRSASEYALLSSIFAFSRSVAGWAGGFGAEAMGYAPYFTLTFFLAFPAYLFLPWVKRMLESQPDWNPGTRT
ncbi:PAT family beta-lactamase induction signal transducer AmpG [Nitrospina gracilis]|uniref:MFS transporter n=1 Tax=Nitrospina TaxID=35800 RepID=UPI00034A3B4D|nr:MULTISPECIES: MFS transporter [Nitrospina]MCF8724560.1 PAT family beta-lactamase induction signal transducer AmpG [Nitrospina sp. Nb-3]